MAGKMPTLQVPYGPKKGKRRELDIHAITEWVRPWKTDLACAVLERVEARPGQGVTGMFRFGQGLGILQGVLGAYNVPVVWAVPGVWKSSLGLGADKAKSLQKAAQLFPGVDFGRHDGMAEAALLTQSALKLVRESLRRYGPNAPKP